jgi:hypothetical protein
MTASQRQSRRKQTFYLSGTAHLLCLLHTCECTRQCWSPREDDVQSLLPSPLCMSPARTCVSNGTSYGSPRSAISHVRSSDGDMSSNASPRTNGNDNCASPRSPSHPHTLQLPCEREGISPRLREGISPRLREGISPWRWRRPSQRSLVAVGASGASSSCASHLGGMRSDCRRGEWKQQHHHNCCTS